MKKDKDYLINSYIGNEVKNYTNAELNSEAVQNGDYALLTSSIVETGNQALLTPGVVIDETLNGEMAVRRTITRLPLTDNS